MNTTLKTICPSIAMSSGNQKRNVQRAVRLYNGTLCISARKSLYAITVTGPNKATCDLDATPLVTSVIDAQAIAPVCTNAVLGIVRKPKIATQATVAPVPDVASIAAAVVEYLKMNTDAVGYGNSGVKNDDGFQDESTNCTERLSEISVKNTVDQTERRTT